MYYCTVCIASVVAVYTHSSLGSRLKKPARDVTSHAEYSFRLQSREIRVGLAFGHMTAATTPPKVPLFRCDPSTPIRNYTGALTSWISGSQEDNRVLESHKYGGL